MPVAQTDAVCIATRIYAIKWNFSEVSITNESALVKTIMLHIKEMVDSYLLVAFW